MKLWFLQSINDTVSCMKISEQIEVVICALHLSLSSVNIFIALQLEWITSFYVTLSLKDMRLRRTEEDLWLSPYMNCGVFLHLDF